MFLNRKRMRAAFPPEVVDYTTHGRAIYDEYMEACARPVEVYDTVYRTGASYHAYASALLNKRLSVSLSEKARKELVMRRLRAEKIK